MISMIGWSARSVVSSVEFGNVDNVPCDDGLTDDCSVSCFISLAFCGCVFGRQTSVCLWFVKDTSSLIPLPL